MFAAKTKERKKKIKAAGKVSKKKIAGAPKAVGTVPKLNLTLDKLNSLLSTQQKDIENRKVEEKIISKIDHRGPPPSIDLRADSGDAGIDLEYNVADMSYVQGLAGAIIAHCVNVIGSKVDFDTNAAYAALYLTKWLTYLWNGWIPPYDLPSAPAIVYDLMYAGLPKTIGRTSVHMTFGTISDASFKEYTLANYGFLLGIASASASGYYEIDTSIASYTDADGFRYLRDIFQAASKSVDIVEKDQYKNPFDKDDLSFFACSSNVEALTALSLFQRHRISGTSYPIFRYKSLFCKIKTPWLARVSLPSTTSSTGGMQHVIPNRGPPGGMIWLRMEKKYRGRQAANEDVMLAYLDMWGWIHAVASILKWGEEMAGGSTFPFQDADHPIALTDFKIAIFNQIQRWCHDFAGASTGAAVSIQSDGSSLSPCCSVGTGFHIPQGSEDMKFPQITELSLSRLYPSRRGKTHLVPAPFISADITSFAYGPTFAADSSYFLSLWNWFTKQNALAVTVSPMVTTNITTFTGFIKNWNQSMGKFSNYLPMASKYPADAKCNGSMDLTIQICDGLRKSKHFIRYKQLDEDFGPKVNSTFLLCVPMANYSTPTDETGMVGQTCVTYRCPFISSNGVKEYHYEQVANVWYGTAHEPAAFGDPGGLVTPYPDPLANHPGYHPAGGVSTPPVGRTSTSSSLRSHYPRPPTRNNNNNNNFKTQNAEKTVEDLLNKVENAANGVDKVMKVINLLNQVVT